MARIVASFLVLYWSSCYWLLVFDRIQESIHSATLWLVQIDPIPFPLVAVVPQTMLCALGDIKVDESAPLAKDIPMVSDML